MKSVVCMSRLRWLEVNEVNVDVELQHLSLLCWIDAA